MGIEPTISRLEIRDHLSQEELECVWSRYLNWVGTTVSIWHTTIEVFADNTSLPRDKRDKHLGVIATAIDLMDGWRLGRTKHVKARINEIDSAISYLRNAALYKENASLLISPMARNLAGVLRIALRIADHSYGNDKVPELVACSVYELAECRSLFPVDTDLFVEFLPPGLGLVGNSETYNQNNYHIMMARGCKELRLEQQLEALNDEVVVIWRNWDSPIDWHLSDEVWSADIGTLSKDLYYSSVRSFHDTS